MAVLRLKETERPPMAVALILTALTCYGVSLLLRFTALTCYGVSLLLRWGPSLPVGNMQLFVLIAEALGALFILAAGWFGRHLVFHHGLGKT